MDIRRHLLGLVGVGFVVAWLAILFSPRSDHLAFLAASCMRIGVVLVVLWLALPQLQDLGRRFPPWMIGAAGLAILIIAIRPKFVFYAIPILAALAVVQFIGWIFRPPPGRN